MRARACLRLGARGLSKGHCVRALATLSPRTHTAYRRRSSRSREDLREERCEERRSSRSRLECRGSWWSPLLAVFAELSAATGAASGTSRCPTHGGQPPLVHRHGASRNLSTPTIAYYHAPGASDMVSDHSAKRRKLRRFRILPHYSQENKVCSHNQSFLLSSMHVAGKTTLSGM